MRAPLLATVHTYAEEVEMLFRNMHNGVYCLSNSFWGSDTVIHSQNRFLARHITDFVATSNELVLCRRRVVMTRKMMTMNQMMMKKMKMVMRIRPIRSLNMQMQVPRL